MKRTPGRLRRVLAWTVGVLMALALTGYIYWRVAGRARVLAVANSALESLLAGRVEVLRFESVSLWGASGIDARLRDPQGRIVAEVEDVSANIAVIPLLEQVIFGDGNISLVISKLRVRDARLYLAEENGELTFLQAIEVPAAPPSTDPETLTLVRLEAVELDHAWVHGALSGTPIDFELSRLGVDVNVEAVDIIVTVERGDWLARSLPGIGTARGSLDGALRYSDPGDSSVVDALADVVGHVRGGADGRTLIVSAEKHGPDVQFRADLAELRSSDFAAWGVPFGSPDPTSLELEGKGTLARLDFRGRGAAGPSAVSARGTVKILPERALDADVELEQWRLASLVAGLDAGPLDGSFHVHLASAPDGLRGELNGRTQGLRLLGQHVPPLAISVDLGPARMRAQIVSERAHAATRVEVWGPSPLKLEQDSSYEFELRSSLDDVRALVGPLPIEGTGPLQASGKFQPNSERIDAQANAQLWHIAAAGASIERVNVRARVQGPLDNPELDVSVWGKKAVLQERAFEEFTLTSHGNLERSRAEIALQSKQGDVTVRSDWGASAGLIGEGLDVDFRKGKTRLHVEAKRLRLRGDRLLFEDLRVNGAGTLEASGYFSPTALKLVGSARDLDLQLLADAAQLQGYQLGGQLDFDADFELDINHARGRATLRMKDLKLPEAAPPEPSRSAPAEKVSFIIDAIGNGPSLLLNFNGGTSEQARQDGTNSQAVAIDVKSTLGLGRLHSLFDGQRWLDSALGLEANADVDLGRLSQLLPPSFGATADGSAHLELYAERVRQAAPPSFDLHVRTLGLVVRFMETGSQSAPAPRGIDDVDVHFQLSHEPSNSLTELKGGLTYKTKPFVRAEIQATAALADWLEDPGRTLRTAQYTAQVRLLRRRIAGFPPYLAFPQLRGEVMAELDVQGTWSEPRVHAAAQVFDLSADVRDPRPIEGNVSFDYQSRKLLVRAEGTTEQQKRIDLEARATMTPRELGEQRLPQDLEVDLSLDDFPVGLFPAVDNNGIRGQVDARLKAKGLGSDDPVVHAELDLAGIELHEFKLIRGQIMADLDRERLAAEAHLAAKDWSIEARGRSDLHFETPWEPSLGERQEGELTAKQFRLAWLMPMVARSIAELDGRLDADIQARRVGDGTTVTGSARLRDGKLQVPAIGQQLQEIQADFAWNEQGRIELTDASFRGTTGRGRVGAHAEMDGLAPRRADLELTIARNERVPLSLEGFGLGEIYGQIRAHADFDTERRRIVVKAQVPEFSLRMPEIPTADVQPLEPDEHVAVGVHLGRKRFVTLPIQPIEDEVETVANPWTTELDVELGSAVWIQQGPTRRVQIGGGMHIALAEELRLTGRLTLSRGRIEINGRRFDVEEGTITFQPDEPANPIVVAEASWTAPDGTVVFASFVGPIESGKMTLRSEPALSRGEILSLVLFGTTDGLNNVGSASSGSSAETQTSQAVAVGGGVATQGFNQALSRLNAVDISTRIDSDESGNARPEVVIQLSSSLSAQVGYNIAAAAPGKSPDRTLLVLELRLVGGHSVATTIGDKGTGLIDYTWRYRY